MYKLAIGDRVEIGPIDQTGEPYAIFTCVNIKDGEEVGSPEPVYYFVHTEVPSVRWQLRESFLKDWTRAPRQGWE